jgi:cytochrome b subunit of formate dehydrogenase
MNDIPEKSAAEESSPQELPQVEAAPPEQETVETEPIEVEPVKGTSAEKAEIPPPPNEPLYKPSKGYLRFVLASRIEHWVFVISFITLAITGLVQKFATNPFSDWVVNTLGGIENTRIIHHVAATLTLLSVVYHIGALGYKLYVRRDRANMLPGLQDFRNAWQSLLYNFGLSKTPPQQARYGYEEKMEYWAVVWGTIIMAITGFMMWNPIATTRFLPGEIIPAAKAAHGWEAVLAVSAIILWHFYHVLVRTFNRSMFTGYISEHEMVDEHPQELADIKAGVARTPSTKQGRQKRLARYLPVYTVLAAALLVGIYFFVAYEETAIAYEPPPEQVEVFVPLTPTPLPTPVPTKTPIPGGLASWEAGVGELFQTRCVICHNIAGNIGGLDLSRYESSLAGGNSGPGIVPGEPENSQVIIIQQAGSHPGQLSEDEIQQLIDWIENGAPER